MAELKVLVTGALGQLGRELSRYEWPGQVQLTGVDIDDFDLCSAAAVETAIGTGGFDIVVNAAAYTAVDKAEGDPSTAHAVNETAAAYLAESCARHGAALVHISTDYVFDGTKPTPYVEVDNVAPASVYGVSKAAGEHAIQARLDRHVILRTAWLYSVHGSNFVKTMLRLANEHSELRVVADQTGNPTSAADLAEAVAAVTIQLGDGRTDAWGIYHCTNNGATTWHEFTQEIVRLAASRLSRVPTVTPITTADYPTPAARPANSQLDCNKLEQVFGVRMRSWPEALKPVVEELIAPGNM